MTVLPIGVRTRVEDQSQVAEARRAAGAQARAATLAPDVVSRVELVATELATNLVLHGDRGQLVVQREPDAAGGPDGLLLLALDHGPGIPNLAAAMRDGWSTGGTSGNGLGAARRAADRFDVYSLPHRGTVVAARFGAGPRRLGDAASSLNVAALRLPKAGQEACGDVVVTADDADAPYLAVFDGLGHGPEAQEAATLAARTVLGGAGRSPAERIDAVHAALRGTRGAVGAVARPHPGQRTLTYAGVGNIGGRVLAPGRGTGLICRHGTLGSGPGRGPARSQTAEWAPDGVLLMHSDGVSARWSADDSPGLLARDPALICGVVLRDAGTFGDDVAALVARQEQR